MTRQGKKFEMFTIIYLSIVVIFSLKFFDATIAQEGIIKYVNYLFLALIVFQSMPYVFKYKGGFVFPIQIISFSILVSIIMSNYTWNQGFKYGATTIPYLIWFIFFYLLKFKPHIKVIENVVIAFGILYLILFLFQFFNSNTVYFGYKEEFKQDRGIVRIVFPGGGLFFLSCFIAINKFTDKVKYRYFWLFFALVGILVTTLQVTRQQILILLLIYLYHLTLNVKIYQKVLVLLIFTCGFIFFLKINSSLSKGLINQQTEDMSAGAQYIRVLSAEFYLTEFSPAFENYVFGNGIPNNTSRYGRYVTTIEEKYGYYMSDVGLVQVYALFGIFAVIGYLWIFWKSLFLSLPINYHYLKYYMWMLFATCLTSDSIISYSYLITTVFVLYSYQILLFVRKYNSQKLSYV